MSEQNARKKTSPSSKMESGEILIFLELTTPATLIRDCSPPVLSVRPGEEA